jgi:hypothetical protein
MENSNNLSNSILQSSEGSTIGSSFGSSGSSGSSGSFGSSGSSGYSD